MVFLSSLTLIIGFIIYKIIRIFLREPPPVWLEEDMNNHGPGTRKLGYMEGLMVEMVKTGSLLLSNALIIRSKKKLTVQVVNGALMMLAKRHPLLTKCVKRETDSKDYYFEDIPDFKVNLRLDHSEDWKLEMENELLTEFDSEKGPLWRVVFLPNACYSDDEDINHPFQCVCIFVFHHVITDGTSYTRLFGEFTERLDDIIKSKATHVEKMDLLPPIDAYIDDMRTNSTKEKLIRNFASLIMKRIPLLLRFMARRVFKIPHFVKAHGVEEDRDPNIQKRTCIIPVELSVKDTSQVLAACKKHNIKVHGALHTAAVIAYAKLVMGEEVEEMDIRAGPTVNLRPFLGSQVPAHYLGPYFLAVNCKSKVGPKYDFWEIAAEANTKIHKQMETKSMILMFRMMSDIGIMKEVAYEVLEDRPGRRANDLVFTNLGNLSFLNSDELSDVKITARFGCSSEQHTAGSVFANNIATFNGKLFWTFVYYSNITKKDVAKKFSNLTIEALLEAVQA